MTNIPAFLAAYWWLFVIALAVVIILIVGVSWAVSWYFWRWFVKAYREPEHVALKELMGDLPHVPEKAKRKFLNGLHPTKGYGWASRHGKRANG